MSPKFLKSPLAFLVVAGMLFSLLPPVFDTRGHALAAQTGSNTQPRRGKNGLPTKSSQRPAQKNTPPQDEEEADREPEPSPDTEETRPATNPSTRPARRDADTAPQTSTAPQTKRTPPPFDRPPLTTSGEQGSVTGAPPASNRQTQNQPPPTANTQSYPRRSDQRQSSGQVPSDRTQTERTRPPAQPQDYDPDDENADRTGKQRPVLRRPTDSRNPQDVPRSREDREDIPPQQPGDDEAIRLDATLVNIPLLVSDRSGRYIARLGKQDFSLYEDGVQQEIAFFGSEEVPFNVVLLLDMSPSVAGYVDEIHRAAIEFVRQLRQNDRIMVVSFDRSVHFLTDFTSNRRLLENAIRSTSTGAGTSVYDAVFLSVQRKLRGIEGRKALILFSDGEDTTSGQADYGETIDAVTESDVLVYGLRYPSDGGGNIQVNPWPRSPIPQIPIPFPWPWPRRRRGPFTGTNFVQQSSLMAMTTMAAAQRRSGRGQQGDFMDDVATAGGGPVYDADQVSDISRLANRIAEELRHVYVVSYYPTNPLTNGGFRSIRVRVKGRDDIAVRHRRGYNARDMASQPRT